MRSISTDLLEKIQKSQQTIYQNANPALKVLLSKGFRKDLFRVYTIHNDELLEGLDVAVRRMGTLGKPNKVYVAYIKDGVAHVKSKDLPYDETLPWDYGFQIGLASEVAIEFDGYWEKEGTSGRWNLITGEFPYIFKVVSGTLSVQLWNGSPVTLATGVSKISALRGWKSAMKPTDDHGLIIAYIKSGGVYYRNLCEQPNGSIAWEDERQLTVFTGTVVDISMFRTNDFRTGFVVQNSDLTVEMVVTDRNWSGMAIPPETISATLGDVVVSYDYIEYPKIYGGVETIFASADHIEAYMLWGASYNAILSAENQPDEFNDWGFSIMLTFEHGITTPSLADFNLSDENSAIIHVLGITQVDETICLIETSDFNNAFGDITVNFLGSGNTKGENGQDMDAFSYSFTPINLVPTAIPVPEVEVIYNE